MKFKVIIASTVMLTNSAFSQNYSNLKFSAPLVYNPALTGLQNDKEVNLRFTHSYGFNTLYGDYNQYSEKLHGGIGIYFNTGRYDLIDENFYDSRISYAFQNKINEKWNYSLGTSIALSGGAYKFNNETTTYLNVDFSLGGMIYTDQFFTTFSANNLLSGHADYNLGIGRKFEFKNSDFSFTPYLSLVNRYNTMSVDADIAFQFKKINFGLGYEHGRPSANVGYDFKKMRINYSMGNFNNGIHNYNSHELSLKLKFNNSKSNRTKFNTNLF